MANVSFACQGIVKRSTWKVELDITCSSFNKG